MIGQYTKIDITNAISSLGIGKGDTLYITSSLGFVGIPPSHITDSAKLCHIFYDSIREVIGIEGTIMVPTFSYSFGRSTETKPVIYSVKNTPSKVGIFSNFILNHSDSDRSIDPMVSVSGIGPNFKSFINSLPHSSYGEGSFLSRLAKSEAKLLNIGIGPGWLPFVHYIDWLNKAPYRYDKIFHGIIENKHREKKPQDWLYSVKSKGVEAQPETQTIGKLALNKGIWERQPLGKINIYACACNDYFEFALKESKINKWILCKGNDFDPISLDLKHSAGKK